MLLILYRNGIFKSTVLKCYRVDSDVLYSDICYDYDTRSV